MSHALAMVIQGGTRFGVAVRSAEEWDLVTRWIAWGLNDCQIGRLTGIPRTTVREWRHLGRKPGTLPDGRTVGSDCPICNNASLETVAYSYLFGLYLGDGHISSHARGVFKLRIFLDNRYPNIIKEAGDSMRRVRPQVINECDSRLTHWVHRGLFVLEALVVPFPPIGARDEAYETDSIGELAG